MGQIILVTGGISSGKSAFAEDLVTKISQDKSCSCTYIATASVYDDEMREKVRLHQQARQDKNWSTLEAYKNLGQIVANDDFDHGILLLDCLTMMVSNIIFEDDMDFDGLDQDKCRLKEDLVLNEIRDFVKSVRDKDLDLVLVTNEIGLGGISYNKLSRFYTQLVGRSNQYIASQSDQVYMVVSSIGERIK